VWQKEHPVVVMVTHFEESLGKFVSSYEEFRIQEKLLGADKSLVLPEREKSRTFDRDGRDFNNIETRAVIRYLFLQSKAPKEIQAILTETLACFLSGRTKDLSAPM
jgi:hypothetical protein